MKTLHCSILALWAIQWSLALVLPNELVDNMRQFIVDNNLDPCKLPDLSVHTFKGQGFDPEMVDKMRERMNSFPDCEDIGNISPEAELDSNALAEAKLYNGYLKSLSSINREGSTSFQPEDDHFLLKESIIITGGRVGGGILSSSEV